MTTRGAGTYSVSCSTPARLESCSQARRATASSALWRDSSSPDRIAIRIKPRHRTVFLQCAIEAASIAGCRQLHPLGMDIGLRHPIYLLLCNARDPARVGIPIIGRQVVFSEKHHVAQDARLLLERQR